MRLGIALCLPLVLSLAGCGNDPAGYVPFATPATNVLSVDIDTGASLEAEPGKGVGVQVAYVGDGAWRIAATCDTIASGYACSWDLVASVASPGAMAFTEEASTVGAEDRVLRVDPAAYRLVLWTEKETDLVELAAPPDEPLQLDVFLDGSHDSAGVSWVEGHVVKSGAPSNPIEFSPIVPAP